MRIAYLGYDLLYPCLTALADSGCDIMEVFTFPTDDEFEFNRDVKGFAAALGVPCTQERITLADIHRLRDAGCEAIVCAGYLYKVPIDHSIPIVNVHPALLPIGRGAWPMPVTLLRGLTVSGVTLHKMEAEFDTGDILLQQSFPVGPEDTLETMTAAIREIGAGLCRELAADFSRYWNSARPQGSGEYWPCPDEEDCTVTPETAPERAELILRAFLGFDCYLQGEGVDRRIVGGLFRPMEHRRPFGEAEKCPGGGIRYYIRGGVVECPPVRDRRHKDK